MEPKRNGDVEWHEGGHWYVGVCTGVGGSVGGSTGVDGTGSVGNGAGIGGGCSENDGAGIIDGTSLCGSDFWVVQWGFCGSGGAGVLWTSVVF